MENIKNEIQIWNNNFKFESYEDDLSMLKIFINGKLEENYDLEIWWMWIDLY